MEKKLPEIAAPYCKSPHYLRDVGCQGGAPSLERLDQHQPAAASGARLRKLIPVPTTIGRDFSEGNRRSAHVSGAFGGRRSTGNKGSFAAWGKRTGTSRQGSRVLYPKLKGRTEVSMTTSAGSTSVISSYSRQFNQRKTKSVPSSASASASKD